MQNTTELGRNRTGVQMSPADTREMLKGMEDMRPSTGDETAMAEIRTSYIREAEPVGSVPVPANVKGMAKASVDAMTGKRMHVLMDRLGERLAFERTGTRLYEALITKCEAAADPGANRRLDLLNRFRAEEAAHFKMLAQCIESMGGDPTSQTPTADVAGVESSGLLQVISDPKTSVVQSLHAILVAELTDNAGWDELIVLCQEMGETQLVQRFTEARDQERLHLDQIRQWHEQATIEDARMGGSS
jgi:bacterioferritin (cytochrome b1)